MLKRSLGCNISLSTENIQKTTVALVKFKEIEEKILFSMYITNVLSSVKVVKPPIGKYNFSFVR